MLDCCKCTCDPNCYKSTLYLLDEYFCDGNINSGNGVNPPNCPDGSDEVFLICCTGNYGAYDEEICSKF